MIRLILAFTVFALIGVCAKAPANIAATQAQADYDARILAALTPAPVAPDCHAYLPKGPAHDR